VFLSEDVPNYKAWAESMGCVGIRVDSPEEVPEAIAEANQIEDRSVVIDFRTAPEERVYPMVPAGQDNSSIVVPPSQEGKER
jgi:acetolactate synthase-1/2/3 large subunit